MIIEWVANNSFIPLFSHGADIIAMSSCNDSDCQVSMSHERARAVTSLRGHTKQLVSVVAKSEHVLSLRLHWSHATMVFQSISNGPFQKKALARMNVLNVQLLRVQGWAK
jgi:hypothetical protein